MTIVVNGLNLDVVAGDRQITVSFRGSNRVWNEETSTAAARQLHELAGQPQAGTLLVDFGGVAYFTSTMLGKLVGLHKRLRAAGSRLVLVNLQPCLHELFRRTRLDCLMDIRHGPAAEVVLDQD
jgi:anti-anti-sigma factor